jgi:hypothetical protein
MSKFSIGDKVDASDAHESGQVIAIFLTVEDNFIYAVNMEGCGALEFLDEEKLVVTAANRNGDID